MPLRVDQEIKAGAAQFLVGTPPVEATAGIVDAINNGAGYTATDTAISFPKFNAMASLILVDIYQEDLLLLQDCMDLYICLQLLYAN